MRRASAMVAALAAFMAAGPRDEVPPEGYFVPDRDCARRLSDMRERMRHPGTPIEAKAALAEAYARDCGGRDAR